jgi:antitoxin VapB
MSLNIKNKDAHKLAQQLSRLTGESMTEAVTEAVRERLKKVQDQNKHKHDAKLADRLLEIGRDCAVHLKEPFRSAEHGDLLYDEKGLPK